MDALHKNIKKLRTLKGMNQSEFAQLFDLTRANIGSYEEGRAQPKITVLNKIANHFGLSLDQFVNQELTINELSSFSLVKENPLVYNTQGSKTVQVPFIQSSQFRKYISLGRTSESLCIPSKFSGDLALELDHDLAHQLLYYQAGDVVVLKKLAKEKSAVTGTFLSWSENKLQITPVTQNSKSASNSTSSGDRVWEVVAGISSNRFADETRLMERIDRLEATLTSLISSKK